MDADAIARIETFPLRIPFRAGEARPPVDSLLVKVTTVQGYEGWGEAFGFEGTPVTRRAVEDLIAPLCAGQDPAQISPLMRQVQEKLQVFGRGGAVISQRFETVDWSQVRYADYVPVALDVTPAARGTGPRWCSGSSTSRAGSWTGSCSRGPREPAWAASPPEGRGPPGAAGAGPGRRAPPRHMPGQPGRARAAGGRRGNPPCPHLSQPALVRASARP